MGRVRAWFAADPEVAIAWVLLVMITWRLWPWALVAFVVLRLTFRALLRWCARKLSYCSPYDTHEVDLCADRRWPRMKLARWWTEVTA